MRQTLDDIFYGKIRPFERGYYYLPEYVQNVRALDGLETQLNSFLSPEAAELFERYQEIKNDLLCITKSESFKDGFSLAIRLILESYEPSPPSSR